MEEKPDERALFAALHTCAFHAAQCGQRKSATAVDHQKWSGRWRRLRECIVSLNLGLAHSMVWRLNPSGRDEDDALSEAMYALARAVERFNPWQEYRFSTFACTLIARSLKRRGTRETRYRALFPVQHDVGFERPSRMSDASVELFTERLNRALTRNLADLTPLEARIIDLRFPGKYVRRSTFREIGDAVGLSIEGVRQVQIRALSKLRDFLETDPVLQ